MQLIHKKSHHLLQLEKPIKCRMKIIKLRNRRVETKPANIVISHVGYEAVRFSCSLKIPVHNLVTIIMELSLECRELLVIGELVTLWTTGNEFVYEVALVFPQWQRQLWITEIQSLAMKQNPQISRAYRSYNSFANISSLSEVQVNYVC
jgi:hypothetical protein